MPNNEVRARVYDPVAVQYVDALLAHPDNPGDDARRKDLREWLDAELPLVLHHTSPAEHDVFNALLAYENPTTDTLRSLLAPGAIEPTLTHGETDYRTFISDFFAHGLSPSPMNADAVRQSIGFDAKGKIEETGGHLLFKEDGWEPLTKLFRLSGRPTARLIWLSLYTREITNGLDPRKAWMGHAELADVVSGSNAALYRALTELAQRKIIHRRNGIIRLTHMYSPRTQAALFTYAQLRGTGQRYLGTGYSIDDVPSAIFPAVA